MILFLLLSLIFPLATLFIFEHVMKNRKTSRYPPGPPGLPFIGNLLQFDTSSPHIYLWKLAKKYGPLVSMKLGSVPVLVVLSPKTAQEVLKTNDLSFCSRPRVLGQVSLSYNRSDIAFAPYSESWRELRKLCVLRLFSHKQVHSFRPVREEEVYRMIGSISEKAVVDVSATVMSLTSVMVCRVAFGKLEGFMRRRIDDLMIESQMMLCEFSFVSDYLPWFGWVDKLTGMIGKLERICKDLDDFYQEIIDERLHLSRRDQMVSPDNILDLLIELKEEKSSSVNLTWDRVKAILMNIFIAGTDTGASALAWTMTALVKEPTSMKKLQKEIRELIGEKGKVDEDDLPNLPYLKAVIKETLRLYPPAPLLFRQTLKKCIVNGYTIQPNTMVFINAWAIARDPEYWESPNEFRPERFLNTDVDVVGQDFQVIPFGSGRRGCPGMSLGLSMVEIALANLIYAFDWELPPGMGREDIDNEVLPGLTTYKKNPLCLVPTKYA